MVLRHSNNPRGHTGRSRSLTQCERGATRGKSPPGIKTYCATNILVASASEAAPRPRRRARTSSTPSSMPPPGQAVRRLARRRSTPLWRHIFFLPPPPAPRTRNASRLKRTEGEKTPRAAKRPNGASQHGVEAAAAPSPLNLSRNQISGRLAGHVPPEPVWSPRTRPRGTAAWKEREEGTHRINYSLGTKPLSPAAHTPSWLPTCERRPRSAAVGEG